MKFKVTQTSKYNWGGATLDVDSLDALLDWVKNTGTEVILTKATDGYGEPSNAFDWEIEIYDTYRE